MINLAIISSQEETCSYLSSELSQCFSFRNLNASVHCFTNLNTLPVVFSSGFRPNICFFETNSFHQQFVLDSFQFFRTRIPDCIFVFLGEMNALMHSFLSAFPFQYSFCPAFSRKKVWEYAHKSYDLWIQNQNEFYYFKRPKYSSIPLSSIQYFYSQGRLVHIISSEEPISFYYKMDEIEKILSNHPNKFVRIHKSYIVNTSYVSSFDKQSVTLLDGTFLTISKPEYYRQLANAIAFC